jgi:hypothetical protein
MPAASVSEAPLPFASTSHALTTLSPEKRPPAGAPLALSRSFFHAIKRQQSKREYPWTRVREYLSPREAPRATTLSGASLLLGRRYLLCLPDSPRSRRYQAVPPACFRIIRTQRSLLRPTTEEQWAKRADRGPFAFQPLAHPRCWLNPIEPYWVPSNRAIVAPASLLMAAEVIACVDDCFKVEQVEPLTQKVA